MDDPKRAEIQAYKIQKLLNQCGDLPQLLMKEESKFKAADKFKHQVMNLFINEITTAQEELITFKYKTAKDQLDAIKANFEKGPKTTNAQLEATVKTFIQSIEKLA